MTITYNNFLNVHFKVSLKKTKKNRLNVYDVHKSREPAWRHTFRSSCVFLLVKQCENICFVKINLNAIIKSVMIIYICAHHQHNMDPAVCLHFYILFRLASCSHLFICICLLNLPEHSPNERRLDINIDAPRRYDMVMMGDMTYVCGRGSNALSV